MTAMDLPEWVQWAAGFVGLALAAMAAKLGFNSAGSPHHSAEISTSVVDPALAEAIKRATKEFVDCHEESVDIQKDFLRVFKDLSEEISELRKEVKELNREVSYARSRNIDRRTGV